MEDIFGWLFGGPDRDRTDDLFHAMEARSQLRHRPTLRKDFSYSLGRSRIRQCARNKPLLHAPSWTLLPRQKSRNSMTLLTFPQHLEQAESGWCLRIQSERALCRRRRTSYLS